ncbi:MAG: dehydrogenase flavoprotein [Actinomycetia bacterium]|nr:dehydrogenase flavoprotein [Actinomycetes bacterium]
MPALCDPLFGLEGGFGEVGRGQVEQEGAVQGVSQHLKTWIDLVIAGAGDATGLLKDKPTALVTVRGGGYGPGTPREGWDHSTPYLRRILGDYWQADLTVIERELTLAATTPAMEGLKDLAAQLHTQARDAARHTGRTLAASY